MITTLLLALVTAVPEQEAFRPASEPAATVKKTLPTLLTTAPPLVQAAPVLRADEDADAEDAEDADAEDADAEDADAEDADADDADADDADDPPAGLAAPAAAVVLAAVLAAVLPAMSAVKVIVVRDEVRDEARDVVRGEAGDEAGDEAVEEAVEAAAVFGAVVGTAVGRAGLGCGRGEGPPLKRRASVRGGSNGFAASILASVQNCRTVRCSALVSAASWTATGPGPRLALALVVAPVEPCAAGSMTPAAARVGTARVARRRAVGCMPTSVSDVLTREASDPSRGISPNSPIRLWGDSGISVLVSQASRPCRGDGTARGE
ncbi:hypothetical protein [Microbispora oryzae]|uniref:hypothetical protein n=1 Tax=Microbispora oryzae TaxID=2806554 RepID=UPI001E57CEFA|nr:hypothetical protein [Microbispora oryzae]